MMLKLVHLSVNFFFFDAPITWQINFQDSASLQMDFITDFHQDLMGYLVFICLFVFVMLFYTILLFNEKTKFFYYKNFKFFYQNLTHHTTLEILWTLFPALLIGKLCLASFALTYSLDYIDNPKINFIVTGNQWYWTYEVHHKLEECPHFFNVCFDSYMIVEEDLKPGQFRLLEVDNELVVPYNVEVSFEFSSNDVIHSWAVPSLGIKVDCVPGRINRVSLVITREGIFYGQCSELCGVRHAFMPIKVIAVDELLWAFWLLCVAEKNVDYIVNIAYLSWRDSLDECVNFDCNNILNKLEGLQKDPESSKQVVVFPSQRDFERFDIFSKLNKQFLDFFMSFRNQSESDKLLFDGINKYVKNYKELPLDMKNIDPKREDLEFFLEVINKDNATKESIVFYINFYYWCKMVDQDVLWHDHEYLSKPNLKVFLDFINAENATKDSLSFFIKFCYCCVDDAEMTDLEKVLKVRIYQQDLYPNRVTAFEFLMGKDFTKI